MNMTSCRRLVSMAAVSISCVSGLAFAQATGGPSESETTLAQSKRPPEQAAIDACKGRGEGDRVRFVDARGKSRHYACANVDGVLAASSGVATAARKVPSK